MNKKNYRVKVVAIYSKLSNKVLDVYGASTKDNAEIIQFNYHGEGNQRFIIFELDKNTVMIGSMISGKVLDIYAGKIDNNTKLIQYTPSASANQKFNFKGTNEDFSLIAIHSSKALEVKNGSLENKALIVQNPITNNIKQKFRIKDIDSIFIEGNDIKSLNDIEFPNLTDYNTVLPTQTEGVITSETLIPYFCVKDNSVDSNTQINQTPYYILAKKQYWKLLYNVQFSGAYNESKEVSYTAGMSTQKNMELSKTLNISVGSDFGFSFEGATASISNKIDYELKVSVSKTEEKMAEITATEKVETSESRKGKQFTFAKWCLVDEYILTNALGHVVNRWKIENNKILKEDVYPPSKLSTDSLDNNDYKEESPVIITKIYESK